MKNLKSSTHLQQHSLKIKDGDNHIEASSLSIALLVKLAQATIPKERLGCLLYVFYEANEVLHFIDKMMQTKSSENNDKLAYAESVWRDGNLAYLLPGRIQPVPDDHVVADKTLNAFKDILKHGDIWKDLRFIINFINRKPHSSIDELYESMEQLFVDTLHALYTQLPNAIYKSLRLCPAEEFENTVRTAMEFLFKIQAIECQHTWPFPLGMSSVVNDEPFGEDSNFQ